MIRIGGPATAAGALDVVVAGGAVADRRSVSHPERAARTRSGKRHRMGTEANR
jgi:hypothetical protein